MSNHCTNVICKSCGATYCIKCHRIESLPDPENIIVFSFNTKVSNHYCKYCSGELYIYS